MRLLFVRDCQVYREGLEKRQPAVEILVELSISISRIAIIMMRVQRELDRALTLLRNKIRERGFTQLEVQEALGWGRSYISQLLTKQKSLRIEQVLLILNVIGVDPSEFFGELYRFPVARARGSDNDGYARYTTDGMRFERGGSSSSDAVPDEEFRQGFDELQSLLRGLLQLLRRKGILEGNELQAAVSVSRNESKLGDFDPGSD